ncbi:MAG: DNA replication/repair protein RecF [Bradymonadales bacterium]|nr:DNA replication/repair protein RecF [Bradymonadales bacterium]
MWITRLSVRSYRNIQQADLLPHPRFNLLVGPNGAGKTNLLESIYVLGNVRSFRPAKNQELMRSGSDSACVAAAISGGDGLEKELRLEVDTARKRFLVDGVSVRSFGEYLGNLTTVVFSPDDVQLVRGKASDRRRFLDRVVCTTRPAHLADLQTCGSVLAERNRLLKDNQVDTRLLSAYSEQLLPLTARILFRRLEAVGRMRPLFEEVFSRIFSSKVKVQSRYQCPWIEDDLSEPLPLEHLEGKVGEALERNRQGEIKIGRSLVGPHRDDVLLGIDGMAAQRYASQGQMRSIVLAMKISEILYVARTTSQCPVLLLDDVSSELDRSRNEQLFATIQKLEAQTFITATERSCLHIRGDLLLFKVVSGWLEPIEDV